MYSLLRVSVVIILVALVGCQAAVPVSPKAAAAAIDVQEVVDAWNAHCADYGFLPCPPDAGQCGSVQTMGSMYCGCYFEVDCHSFMQAIQASVLSDTWLDPIIDDELSCVLNDPAWYN